MRLVQKKNTRQLVGSNVLGFIEGSDPRLKDEVVVVSAHYDHLGKRGNSIYHGADDNGSGTSTVMEIAQAFALAKQQGQGPRRSVLCLLVSGEEKGLLGSEYYAEHPIFPLEKTVANVNVDMIGRTDKKHDDNPNYIYVIGSNRLSTELHEINEAANAKYANLELDYTFNAKNDPNRFYYRSDHYNFAKKGIPAIFYFSGTHKDYHQPSDTVDKIMFDKMEKIGHLIFYTSWELANRDERIKVNVKEED
jgi:Zn-dependent M28 family amino/carboxypeptidase